MTNKMRILGGDVSNQYVIEKVLRSLFFKFNNVVSTIEISKDLTSTTIDESSNSKRTNKNPVKNLLNKLSSI